MLEQLEITTKAENIIAKIRDMNMMTEVRKCQNFGPKRKNATMPNAKMSRRITEGSHNIVLNAKSLLICNARSKILCSKSAEAQVQRVTASSRVKAIRPAPVFGGEGSPITCATVCSVDLPHVMLKLNSETTWTATRSSQG